jgi:hypothetical protein
VDQKLDFQVTSFFAQAADPRIEQLASRHHEVSRR